jgi:protein-tyrosine phosphatase
MAELLARDRYGAGHTYDSSGVWAMTGWDMTDLAREVIAEIGVDDPGHVARPFDRAATADEPDQIFVMTSEHLDRIRATRPDLMPRTELLDPHGRDIADPYGGSIDDYRHARDHIIEALETRLG